MNDPAVLDLVIERGVVIEACPTSNVHTGVIRSLAEHPIRQWLDAGVKVCLCTDNTLLSSVSSSEEHDAVQSATGLSTAQRDRVLAIGHHATFSSH